MLIWNDEIAKGAIERASGGVDMRYNDFRIGRLRVKIQRHPWSVWPSRFGGGWNWHIGVQAGGTTAIVFLLVSFIIINWGEQNEVSALR